MAVAYDNSVTVHNFGVTTLTTGSFTIGSGANRAAMVCLHVEALFTSAVVSLGGVSATPISGATIDFAGPAYRITVYQVINPPTGSQTATASWTTAGSASLGVITATGVDQTTPCNNGTGQETAFNVLSNSKEIASASGDLTSSWCADSNADTTLTTNQTKKVSDFGNGDVGPGTGTTTHTWTIPASNTSGLAGANFKVLPATTDQEGFRWRNDDGSETTATWKAAQDTPVTLPPLTTARLRLIVNASGDPASTQYRLEYRKVGDASWRTVDTFN